ncbi:hypothetical protein EYC87_05330 [Halieaceae bacterium IMCC8485]|uniref:Uncharacterized protein n=1 Tax=Candidatus Seongchinamella marina TaxID=2518990 RepID=A0ABT3STP0_9GAMM|nr:hypothetical protein [Candidatus Seongchinamella marina]MCX2973006.1 hypothetical protein [Candidatus Seongchinamella marina]
MKTIIAALLAVTLSISAKTALGGPDESMRYMRTESASLLDLFLLKLNLIVFANEAHIADFTVSEGSAVFNFDDKRINVTFDVTPDSPPISITDAKQRLFHALKQASISHALVVADHIGHDGYMSAAQPENLDQDVKSRMLYSAVMYKKELFGDALYIEGIPEGFGALACDWLPGHGYSFADSLDIDDIDCSMR